MVHALRSRRVVTPEGVREAAVVIRNERIEAVLPVAELGAQIHTEDYGDLTLLPGLVDVHTHINEPGRTEWEGFRTGTRAAAAGGFTTITDMPLNCLPETTTPEALALKRAAARGQCAIDFALWGGAVDGNVDQLAPLAAAGVAGFKCFLIYPGCEGFTSIDRENLEGAAPVVAATGLPLLVHAELDGPIQRATSAFNEDGADWRRYPNYLASRPDEAEVEAITMLLDLCRRYRFHLHIVHLSSAEALPILAAAKREGLPLTVETCPHYLHLAAEDIPDGATEFKCAPPIRSGQNREALWNGLADGTIDLIATDHSPCPPEMKTKAEGRFDRAWGGIASLSTALPVVWTECVKRGFGLDQLVRWMSASPAQLAGLDDRLGGIAPGKLANLLVFDPEASFTLTAKHLHYRHPVSPYLGETLQGVVRSTYLRGRRVFHEGHFEGDPEGVEIRTTPPTLRSWNLLNHAEAVEAILPANGSRAWAEAMSHARPVHDAALLYERSDEIWRELPAEEWQEAFASHPRIGERNAKDATQQSLAWSSREQTAALSDLLLVQSRLREGNEQYEARFGRVFLVCASGKSATEMLAILERRLGNDPETELLEAAEQQRRITQLRLRKWLGYPAPSCEAV